MDRKAFAERLKLCMVLKTHKGKKTTAYRMEQDKVVRQSTMENYLKTSTVPDIEGIVELANYFDVELEWLITGEGPMKLELPVDATEKLDVLIKVVERQNKLLTSHEKLINRLVSIIDDKFDNGTAPARAPETT